MAWVAIFLVISLEGWTDIMYYVQDAHSFWDWIYFVLLIVVNVFLFLLYYYTFFSLMCPKYNTHCFFFLLSFMIFVNFFFFSFCDKITFITKITKDYITKWLHLNINEFALFTFICTNFYSYGNHIFVYSTVIYENLYFFCLFLMFLRKIGSFFMINLCLVVIATQFSETKKREMERMRQERARYTSTSTITSSTNNSEPSTCYAEIVKYIAHLWRRGKRRLIKKLRTYKYE